LGIRVTRVAVVGAGWAGLSAAVSLADHGIPVTVFEASRSLGGRARRVSVDGVDLDNGQHILIGAYRETLALMRKVGADPGKFFLRLPLELRFADGFHLRAPRLPYPLNLLAGLLGARGLSLAQGLAAVRFMARMRQRAFRVQPDCSVAVLLETNGQSGALRRYLWEPLCISALNTPPTEASAQVFANVLRDGLTGARENSDLLLPRTDLSRLFPEPAAAFITGHGGSIEMGVAVRRVTRDETAFRLYDRPQRFTHVVIACAPQHAAALLVEFPEFESQRRTIESLQYEPIFTCYLQYPDTVRVTSPMLGLTGPIGQWVFDRGQLSGRRGLLAVVMSASGNHENLPQQELAARIHAELKAALPKLPEPLWSRIIGEKRATFSCRPALERPAAATPVRGLFLAGDYTTSDYPGTLEAAVRSGIAAAKSIIKAQTNAR
jgi:squalene-associated FAD-dependent desaturase